MSFVVKVGKIVLSFVYAIFKLFPCQKNKVLFVSRQSNELTLDFRMLKEELERQNKEIQIISICNHNWISFYHMPQTNFFNNYRPRQNAEHHQYNRHNKCHQIAHK